MDVVWVFAAAGVSLLLALGLDLRNASIRVEKSQMAEISGFIREGAIAYLKRQYLVMAAFAAVMFVVTDAGAQCADGCLLSGGRFLFRTVRFFRNDERYPRQRSDRSAGRRGHDCGFARCIFRRCGAWPCQWSDWVRWVWGGALPDF